MRLLQQLCFISATALYFVCCVPVEPEGFALQPSHSLALEAIFGMGLRLQALQDTGTTKNFVVSPISATLVVAQMMLGAEPPFRDDLYNLLSIPKSPLNALHNAKTNRTLRVGHAKFHLQLMSLIKLLQNRKGGEKFKLVQSNALFYNQNIELTDSFTTSMHILYRTELMPMDFFKETRSTINKWASDHTNGLIKNMLTANPPPDTSAIFMNSIYFLGEWRTPFSDELNRIDEFYTSENSTVNTNYMMGELENIKFIQTEEYRMICLPYKDEELGMYILYPKQDHKYKYDIKKFIEQQKPTEVLQSIAKMKYKDVIVKIPKLSLSNSMSMLDSLRKYATLRKTEAQANNATVIDDKLNALEVIKERIDIYKNFSEPVNTEIQLASAAKGQALKVSDIVQQIVFSINEKGTEAAAVTAGITDYMGGSKTVVLNRPFSFFVRHEATMATIFWGAISDPSSS